MLQLTKGKYCRKCCMCQATLVPWQLCYILFLWRHKNGQQVVSFAQEPICHLHENHEWISLQIDSVKWMWSFKTSTTINKYMRPVHSTNQSQGIFAFPAINFALNFRFYTYIMSTFCLLPCILPRTVPLFVFFTHPVIPIFVHFSRQHFVRLQPVPSVCVIVE